jgi:hypothetical protein
MAADAIGLALRLRLQNLEPKEEGRHGVEETDYAATSGALRYRAIRSNYRDHQEKSN